MTTGTIGDGMPYLVRLDWQEIAGAVALFTDNAIRPTHAVKPLDVQGETISYDPLPVPPYLIFRRVEIQKDLFVFAGEHRVHVPRRFTESGTVPIHSQTATKRKENVPRESALRDYGITHERRQTRPRTA